MAAAGQECRTARRGCLATPCCGARCTSLSCYVTCCAVLALSCALRHALLCCAVLRRALCRLWHFYEFEEMEAEYTDFSAHPGKVAGKAADSATEAQNALEGEDDAGRVAASGGSEGAAGVAR